jgi:O-6-methylguanine DNA methyltransferase
MISQISIKTRVGWVSAFAYNNKIFKIKFGKLKKQTKNKVLDNFKTKLLRYFNKKTFNINIPHKIVGNKIQKKIWAELKNIKIGHTKSYGAIAKKYKLSPRYIGKICSQNKLLLLVPCHRVIRTDGTLGGFTSMGGVKLKKKLLEFEKKTGI